MSLGGCCHPESNSFTYPLFTGRSTTGWDSGSNSCCNSSFAAIAATAAKIADFEEKRDGGKGWHSQHLPSGSFIQDFFDLPAPFRSFLGYSLLGLHHRRE